MECPNKECGNTKNFVVYTRLLCATGLFRESEELTTHETERMEAWQDVEPESIQCAECEYQGSPREFGTSVSKLHKLKRQEHEMTGARNTLTKVTTREDGGFCRTALQLTEGEVSSVDILFPSGEFLCRLNIIAGEKNNWGNVDVVVFSKDTPEEERKAGTAKAWLKGRLVLYEPLPECPLIGVDMQGPKFTPEKP